jgi:hypothetical protein
MATCSRSRSTKVSPEHRPARRAVIVVAVLTGVVALSKRFAPRIQRIDSEKKFERMPDNAPPKWMFNNIKAIRQNTDRILELLEHERPLLHVASPSFRSLTGVSQATSADASPSGRGAPRVSDLA